MDNTELRNYAFDTSILNSLEELKDFFLSPKKLKEILEYLGYKPTFRIIREEKKLEDGNIKTVFIIQKRFLTWWFDHEINTYRDYRDALYFTDEKSIKIKDSAYVGHKKPKTSPSGC